MELYTFSKFLLGSSATISDRILPDRLNIPLKTKNLPSLEKMFSKPITYVGGRPSLPSMGDTYFDADRELFVIYDGKRWDLGKGSQPTYMGYNFNLLLRRILAAGGLIR